MRARPSDHKSKMMSSVNQQFSLRSDLLRLGESCMCSHAQSHFNSGSIGANNFGANNFSRPIATTPPAQQEQGTALPRRILFVEVLATYAF